MNARRFEVFIIAIVALHSLLLGSLMLIRPRQILGLLGWPIEGSVFFASQSGLFLIILSTAYFAALFYRPFAWFLVSTKAIAVVFLLCTYLVGIAPPTVLLVALFDGLMGASALVALHYSAHALTFPTMADPSSPPRNSQRRPQRAKGAQCV